MKRNYLFKVAMLTATLTATLLLLASCTPRRTVNTGSNETGLPLLRERVSIRDFSLPTTSGETITLSELKDDVVLLYFWATW